MEEKKEMKAHLLTNRRYGSTVDELHDHEAAKTLILVVENESGV